MKGGISIVIAPRSVRTALVLLLLVTLLPSALAAEPVAYLSCNEGSGLVAFDATGNGNAAGLVNVSRVESGHCGGALLFNGAGSWAGIPYRSSNHPAEEIAVSGWFFTDSYERQEIISTCHNGGGWCLGFADGSDLWWTVNLAGDREVSLNVQHEGIALNQWHHVAAVYDGETSRIYLDGTLRNRVNASGTIQYAAPNYVILGARAGTYDTPAPVCPRFFRGGLDEVRIYDRAIPYTTIMDDRFACEQGPVPPLPPLPDGAAPDPACSVASGTINLPKQGTVTRTLTFADKETKGTWQVQVQPGSTLSVGARDRYVPANPDSWYVEVRDRNGRIDRSIAFPNTRNTPIDSVIADGAAIVEVTYFDGTERLPATVDVSFTTIAPPPPPPVGLQKTILDYPVIVIYSASWATLIAIALVVLWLHRRRVERKRAKEEEKKQN